MLILSHCYNKMEEGENLGNHEMIHDAKKVFVVFMRKNWLLNILEDSLTAEEEYERGYDFWDN